MLTQIKQMAKLELCNIFGLNVFRFSKDPKAKRKAVLMMALWAFLLIMLSFYVGGLSYGLILLGAGYVVPAYLIAISSLVIFFFGIFKAGSIIFSRNGYDVYCEIPITFAQAALGDEIIVPTLDGKVKFTIHEGTQPGDEFKLKGKGIQRLNYAGKGDQYVKIIVEVPRDLSKVQKEKLKEFASSTDDRNYKRQKSFFDKIKDFFD